MNTMERDPIYIAERVKLLRKIWKLTQQNLADAAGLTSRTIEKIESGRHRPDKQTLRSIARALNIENLRVFEKPSAEEQARSKAEIERASRKMVLVPTRILRSTADVLAAFGPQMEFAQVDTTDVSGDEAIALAASMTDSLRDLMDIWNDIYEAERLTYVRDFMEVAKKLEALGYLCHMGRHRQRMRDDGKPDLVCTAGILIIRPKAASSEQRHAMVQLAGRWETLEEDRPPLSN